MIMNIWNSKGPSVNKAQESLMSHRLVTDGVVAVFAEIRESEAAITLEEIEGQIYAAFKTTLYDSASASGILEDIYVQTAGVKACAVILLNDSQIIVATAGDCFIYEARENKLVQLCDDDATTVEAIALPNDLKARDAYMIVSKGFADRVDKLEMEIDYCKSSTPKQWADYTMLRATKRHQDSQDNYSVFVMMAE